MKATSCPKCGAPLPAKGRFCLECGCDLYGEGVRSAPFPWVPVVAIAVTLGALSAFVALSARSRRQPPEKELVTQMTRELLNLAAERRYNEIVRRFVLPNAEEFQQIDDTLREVVRGSGAPGLNLFRASCVDDLDEARKFVQGYGTEHLDYVAGVLAAITFQDGALRTTLGGTFVGLQRGEEFCAWHLGLSFGGVDARAAQVTDVQWRDGPGGERILVATVRYPQPPALIPGIVRPDAIAWRRLGDGGWALTFGSTLCLDEVLALLQRVKI